MTMTPEQLREWYRNQTTAQNFYLTNTEARDLMFGYAAALEEIERLKAPASEGEIAETLKELREVGFYCEATVQDVIEIIESLAAKVAELEDDKRCLTVANEAMTNQANNAITRAERAEAALADAERKGREQGMREAAGMCDQRWKAWYDKHGGGTAFDAAYVTGLQGAAKAILAAIEGG